LAAVNDDLLAASEREAEAGAKIIVWPEGVPGPWSTTRPD
jgi:hypothetical protein